MSAGSGASNLGYGNITPFSQVHGNYVNVHNSHNPASFGSNEISGTPPGPLPGLAGAKSNIDAAAGNAPGICLFKGGAKALKRKIKNITKKYKMKGGSKSKQRHSLRKKLKSRFSSKSLARTLAGGRRKKTRRHRKRQHGGYAQYQNNLPLTPSYSLGGVLHANQLALANPPPYNVLSNCVNCTDNYSRYSNSGFPSKGH
jgi:hypothetical protein